VIDDESEAAALSPDSVGADAPPPSPPPTSPPVSPPPLPEGPPAATPWRWPQVLLGTIMAYIPEALLTALLVGSGTSSTSAKASIALAVSALVLTAMLDGWQLFSAWTFSLRRGHQSWSAWGFRRPTRTILWIVPAALFAVYAVAIVHSALVHPPEQTLVGDFPHTRAGLAIFLLTVCVAAPFFEETFFRGFIFRGLANSWGAVWAAVVSSAFFAAVHMQLTIFVPIFALGIALCWVYKRTGSIWTNITLHSTFNLISVLVWWAGK